MPTEQGSHSKPSEMITAHWSMLLLGRSEASPGPHHVDSCVFWLSWEAPPQKHSVHVCVTSVEQCRNVLTGSGRWLLSCTTALALALACSWKGTRRRSTNTCLQIDTLLRAFCLYIVIQYKASFVLSTRKELADPLTFSSLYAINHGSIILSSNVSNERGYQSQVGFLR